MNLKEIIDFIDSKIPQSFALDFDNVGLCGEYDLNEEIESVIIFMDLLPQWDDYPKGTLIITHHPPLFIPKTPTYTIHSNWDIIDGGANDALAECLEIEVYDYFDKKTRIGRVCKSNYTFRQLKDKLINDFSNIRIVNKPDDNVRIRNIGIISGFGLKNPEYIKLASKMNIDALISGDLTHESAILAKNLDVTLIDLGHHESEVPGLFKMAEVLDDLNVKVIDRKPIEKL